jgi:isoquinoline 1-oxidoreductase beta subunit
MGRVKTIARRSFLIGSAAIAGGVAFGVYRYKTPYPNPLTDGLAPGEAAPTPYVLIKEDGITLITPRADSGQGVYSAQAAMIAEELDVELDQISVDPGPPSAAYYNTALAEDAAPFRSTDHGFTAESTRTVVDALMKFLGVQVTGGSSSMPDGFEKLRIAGAVARETLKQAASAQTGIDMAQLKTAKGAVLLPDGTSISYTSLAPALADIAPVTDVTLRDPSDWRLIGQPMQRIDILAKSTGTQEYGIDLEMDDMVYAAIKLNPAQTGPMNGFDASEALKINGVTDVIPITGGIGVVATSTWRAFKGAAAVEADWGPAPFPADMAAHWATLADAFTPENQDSRNRDDGDVEAVFEGAALIEAEYRAPYLAHAPLEPISAVVKITNDRADIWTGTQIPRFVQTNVARIARLDADQVHVHVLMMGGSFGHRLEDEVVKQCAEIAVVKKGVPVKLTYSREEDMLHDFPRQIAMARGRGVVKDGKVEGYDLGIAMPSVVVSQMARQGLSVPGPDLQIVAGAWEQPFEIPNYRVTGYRAAPLAPLSSWRAVGASSNGFFHDCFLDELIHAAGADPMEERLRLCWHAPSRKVLEAVKEMSGWDGSAMADGRGRGVGFTLSFGVPVAEVVEVADTADGIRIEKVYVAADVGTIVDPINFENLVAGGVIWGLGHAINCETTYRDGVAEQSNYHAFEGMRMYQTPQIEVRGLENGEKVRGIGEPPVPPASAALANAIFAATGQRIREMPFNKFIKFV